MTNISHITAIDKILDVDENFSLLRGYKIHTNHGEIIMKICGGIKCCEELNVSTSINFQHIIGAEILKIFYEVDNHYDNIMVIIVSIWYKTNETPFEMCEIYLSNSHNGYYYHDVVLDWTCYFDGVENKLSTILSI